MLHENMLLVLTTSVREASIMSIDKICFHVEIREILISIPILSRIMSKPSMQELSRDRHYHMITREYIKGEWVHFQICFAFPLEEGIYSK